MSSGPTSFLDKLKEIFAKIFKSKKNKESSFKTPQELQRSRYGTAAGTPSKTSPTVGAPRTADVSQKPTTAAAPNNTQDPARTGQPVDRAIPRIQQEEESADVSPTEPPTFRTDRPHSAAVSALEQEGVAEKVNNKSAEFDKETGVKSERPISSDVATDSVHTAQSSTIAEKVEEAQTEQTTTTSTKAPEPKAEDPSAHKYPPEKVKPTAPHPAEIHPADRVDPTTAPEVVNRFDDEKVPVITEPSASTPADGKFRMSATSGPLEDFPVGGDFYTQ